MILVPCFRHLLSLFCASLLILTFSACKLEAPQTAAQSDSNAKPGDKPTSCGDCGGGETLRANEELVAEIVEKSWQDFPVFAGNFMSVIYQRSHSKNGVKDNDGDQAFLNQIDATYEKHISNISQNEMEAIEEKLKQSLAFGDFVYFAEDLVAADSKQVKMKGIQESLNSSQHTDLISGIKESSKEAQKRYMAIYWEARVRLLLAKTKLLEEKDCPQKMRGHKQAWVLSHQIGSDICYSGQELSRIAPNSLKEEILSLLFHEFVHLLGQNEESGILWQKKLRSFLSQTEGIQSSYEIIRSFNMINLQLRHKFHQFLKVLKPNPTEASGAENLDAVCEGMRTDFSELSKFYERFPIIYRNSIRYKKADESYNKLHCSPMAYLKLYLKVLELTRDSSMKNLFTFCIKPADHDLKDLVSQQQLQTLLDQTNSNLELLENNVCEVANSL